MKKMKEKIFKLLRQLDYLNYQAKETLEWNFFHEEDIKDLKNYIYKFIKENKNILNEIKGIIENGKYN